MNFTVFLVVVAALVLWAVGIYNALIKLRVMTENTWSDIDVQLKKRHNLIPNLVETVKGYASHEQETFQKVVEARSTAVSAKSVEEQIEAESMLSSMLPKIFALAEAYPELKANSNFIQLQEDLSQIEDDIANARRYYNAVVRDYNTKQQVFPASLIANYFSFTQKPFFEVEEEARAVPKVDF